MRERAVDLPYRRGRWFALGLALGGFALGLWNARDQYFVWDEWTYWWFRHPLLHDGQVARFLLHDHLGHCVALLMAIWAPLDHLFGLRSYLPYLVPTLLAHAAAGYLLFELLLVARVRVTVALGATALALCLGVAAGNVSFAWQVLFFAPVTFAFLSLLALTRPPRSPVGSATVSVTCVFLALASGGVGVTVLAMSTVAALLQGRWRLALVQAALPGGAYVWWRHAYHSMAQPFDPDKLVPYATFMAATLRAAVAGIVGIDASPVVWAVLAAAIAVTVRRGVRREPGAVVPAATLFGALCFVATLATQRLGAPANAGPTSARFVHVASAFLLPSLACLVDRLIGTRRWAGLLAGAWLAWTMVGNVREFVAWNRDYVAEGQRIRALVAASVALGPRLNLVPGNLGPYGRASFSLSVEAVRHLRDEGKLPCDTDPAAIADLVAALKIASPGSAVWCPGPRPVPR